MELRQLRYFIAVAEELSFTGAAQRLRLAQPALSRQISALEREIGAALFERGARGVAITPAGEASLETARQITRDLEDAIVCARESERGIAGPCRLIVGSRAMTTGLVAQIVAAVRTRFPKIDLAVIEGPMLRHWQAIRSGEADLSIGAVAPPTADAEIESEWMADDTYDAAALSVSHPLARRNGLTLSDLASEGLLTWRQGLIPAMTDGLDAELARAHVIPRQRREFDDLYSLLTAVRAGQGWTLARSASNRLLGPDATTVPIVDCRVLVPHTLMRRHGEPRTVVATVSRVIRELMQSDPSSAPGSARLQAVSPSPAGDVAADQIELRQLRYYCAAVSAGSFGRAAEQIGISQPALSRQVRQLERLVRVRLLERESRGATPTAPGRMFCDRATQVLDHVAGLQREAHRAERGRRARCVIGGVPAVVVQRMLHKLLTRAQSSEATAFVFVDIPTQRQPAALRAAEIDVGVCHASPLSSADQEGLRRLPLVHDHVNCALLHPEHHLARESSILLSKLVDTPFLFVKRSFHPTFYDLVFAAFDARSFRPRVEDTYEGVQTIGTLVAQGRGWAIGFESQRLEPPAGTVAVPIEGFSLPCGVHALARSDETRRPVLRTLDLLSEIANGIDIKRS